VFINANASDDGLPSSVLSANWSVTSGPGAVVFSDANAIDTTASFTVAGSYVLRLSVSDGALTASDQLAVTVHVAPSAIPVDLISPTTFVAASANWNTSGEWRLDIVHDGNPATEAHASGDGDEWLEYDLGTMHKLERVRVYEDHAGNYSLGTWKLMIWDGAWRDAFAERSANAAGWHEVNLNNISASRIRFHGRAPSGKGLEIFELECYGVPVTTVPVPPPTQLIAWSINFQPAGSAIPAGYKVDSGDGFAERSTGLSYGWHQNTFHTRDRGVASDQRFDTLNHCQKSGDDARWEIALPAGV
jgi:hypothetical protein